LGGTGKGKTPATENIGLTPEPPRLPPFSLPSIDDACSESTKLWPGRILPNNQHIPTPYGQHAAERIILTAETGELLGKLLLKLIEWMVEPHVIDLTVEGSGTSFKPPANTSVSPSGDKTPTDMLALVAEDTVYFVCVDLIFSLTQVGHT
jgi:hypothetical protein